MIADGITHPRCITNHKDTILKANHNKNCALFGVNQAVLPITKIQFWKQITTSDCGRHHPSALYYQSQRYNFESKSQQRLSPPPPALCCITNHKDTILKANHNSGTRVGLCTFAVLPITKIQFWKQITTIHIQNNRYKPLYYQSQRYNFESKSQPYEKEMSQYLCCITNHKDTILKANHNCNSLRIMMWMAVLPITKIQFWKQITTYRNR